MIYPPESFFTLFCVHSLFSVFGGISILYLPKDKDGLLYIVKRKKYATR